jgi:hypothetical protein|tara:strand:+ start:484 stop:654 length:171 start_codon:yes stop_codon:yes gene_type:complete
MSRNSYRAIKRAKRVQQIEVVPEKPKKAPAKKAPAKAKAPAKPRPRVTKKKTTEAK